MCGCVSAQESKPQMTRLVHTHPRTAPHSRSPYLAEAMLWSLTEPELKDTSGGGIPQFQWDFNGILMGF